MIDDVHDFVRARVDDADLVVNDEIAVVAVVGEEADDLDRNREEPHVARDPPTDLKIESGMVYAGVLEIERTVQPLTIFHAQTRARFANILTPLADMFAFSAFFGALAFLRALLLLSGSLALGVALLARCDPAGAILLGGAPLFGRAVIALALGCPLVFLDCRCGSARRFGSF